VAVPDPPTSVVAIAGNRRATINLVPPNNDGGAMITSYQVTAFDVTTSGNGGQVATAQNPPIAVTGLTSGDEYYFVAKAINSAGASNASSDSNHVVILPPRQPDPPTAISALAGDGQVVVSFVPPADNGGSAVTSYKVTAVDEIFPAHGGQMVTGASSPLTVTGLTNGDGYTFQATATNAQGESAASSKSALVVPEAEVDSTAPPPPYPDAADYPLQKPVNLVQITDELSAAAGQQVRTAVTGVYDFAQPISPTNEAVFWVAPSSVSSSVVEDVLDAHVPNPAYGLNDADLQFQAVLQKVMENPNATLTSDEIQAAVRGLLRRTIISAVPSP
jgi:hypothetical protein